MTDSSKTKKRPAKPAAPTKARELLAFAQEQAKSAKSWVDLHNAVYGIGGKFGLLFPSQTERAAFTKTEEFRELSELIGSLPGDIGLRGEMSGKFMLRLPASLHAALVAEAEAEGVSLNQLCVAKLATQLRALV